MRILAALLPVLLCLSGCTAKAAAEIPEPEPGMQLVECSSSKESQSDVTAYLQLPEDWKLEGDTGMPVSPGNAFYALLVQNEEQSEWVTGGTVIVFGYSDYVDQMDAESKNMMLPSISEIRQNAESSEALMISSIEEFENSGYSAIELDYHYKSDNYHSKDIYVTNESKDQNYFSVQVQIAMDVVDEETADKILDSLVIVE